MQLVWIHGKHGFQSPKKTNGHCWCDDCTMPIETVQGSDASAVILGVFNCSPCVNSDQSHCPIGSYAMHDIVLVYFIVLIAKASLWKCIYMGFFLHLPQHQLMLSTSVQIMVRMTVLRATVLVLTQLDHTIVAVWILTMESVVNVSS